MRPHYLPEVVWLGVAIGDWPLQVFTTEEQVKRWAADRKHGDRERVYWSVAVPADTVVYKAELIPAAVKSQQVHP